METNFLEMTRCLEFFTDSEQQCLSQALPIPARLAPVGDEGSHSKGQA
jgi:hypothetical protein